jgi:hypothetical protein
LLFELRRYAFLGNCFRIHDSWVQMDHKHRQSMFRRLWVSPFHSPGCHFDLLCQTKLRSQYGNLSLSAICLRCTKFYYHNRGLRCNTLYGPHMVHRYRILLNFLGHWIHNRQKIFETNGSNSKTIICRKATDAE